MTGNWVLGFGFWGEDEARLLRGLERRDLDIVAGGYPFFIRKGIPASEALLIQSLEHSGGNWMAHCFIASGNPRLEQAARDYYGKHNIGSIEGDGETARWGEKG